MHTLNSSVQASVPGNQSLAHYCVAGSIVSPRRSSTSPGSDASESEFSGQHFQVDVLMVALGSSQKDLFEDDWLDVMVRVYWLKARFLALQVKFCCFVFLSLLIELRDFF